jgi:AAA domain
VEWLWPDRVPFGAITVLAGQPGLGKSLLTIELASKVSTGKAGREPASVVLLSAEDSRSRVVKPRLEAAGADLKHVHLPDITREGFATGLVFPDDAPRLREAVMTTEAKLVVIDPLSAHLAGRINSWNDQKVREALVPLHRMAEETGAAVLIVAHLNKGESPDPLQRIGGSIGLAAAARSVLLVAPDPDDPDGISSRRRVLAHVKSNVGPLAESRRLMIENARAAMGAPTARIKDVGASPHSASELLAVDPPERGGKLTEAVQFLQSELRDGLRLATELEEEAAKRDISKKTLYRAKTRIRVLSRKDEFGGRWSWELPEVVDDGHIEVVQLEAEPS